jgi:TPR repeat protein
VPNDLHEQVLAVAKDLWGTQDIPSLSISTDSTDGRSRSLLVCEGEAKLPPGCSFAYRTAQFKKEAELGCARAQHSYGLLLWSGFTGVSIDAEASARWHAAAAAQNHLDGMAVLGGCLRTGTGTAVKPKQSKKSGRELGVRLIDYCASQYNPTGVNKHAALLVETNSDERGAADLYQECLDQDKVNALLLFNLGWCHVNGEGVDRKDVDRGESLWQTAAAMAPDEGSEEAAWFLYQQYKRNDPKKAEQWLQLAADLGYEEAVIEQQGTFL